MKRYRAQENIWQKVSLSRKKKRKLDSVNAQKINTIYPKKEEGGRNCL